MSTRDVQSPAEAEDRQADLLMERLRRSMTNHAPSPRQLESITEIRGMAKRLGDTLASVAPHSRERSLAATHLEDCVMWAVKSIILNDDPRYPEQPERHDGE